MKIKVYDLGCERCHQTVQVVRAVAAQFGAEVEVVTGVKAMLQDGIGIAPTVAVDGMVKCSGRVPEESEVFAWLASRSANAGAR